MIDTNKIVEIANTLLAQAEQASISSDLFVVSCTCNSANEVELLIDSDTKVAIDDCIVLSRAIEAEFDRDVEDFQLTVASAGIGSEIKLMRQYPKLIGRSVEVLMADGIKYIGELREATEEAITIAFEKKITVESASGKKKKQNVEAEERLEFAKIKFVKEYLDFK